MFTQTASAVRLLGQSTSKTAFPTGPFDPSADWRHVYRIDVIWRRGKGSDSVNSPNKEKVVVLKIKPDGGSLAIEKQAAEATTRHTVDYQLNMSKRDRQTLRGEIVCRNDSTLTPLSWEYSFSHQPAQANLANYTDYDESGSLKDGRIFRDEQPISDDDRLENPCNEWAMFDLIQKIAEGAAEAPASFDLLEAFTIPRRGQRLVDRGPVEIPAKTGAMELREFVQFGHGLQPRHYYVDPHNRLLIVSDFFRVFQLVEESFHDPSEAMR